MDMGTSTDSCEAYSSRVFRCASCGRTLEGIPHLFVYENIRWSTLCYHCHKLVTLMAEDHLGANFAMNYLNAVVGGK